MVVPPQFKKKPPLGSGKRFAQLSSNLASKGAQNPNALAAYIGRKKYGNAKMQRLAALKRAQNKSQHG